MDESLEPPKTVAEFLWKTINEFLWDGVTNNPNRNTPYRDGPKEVLCYARYACAQNYSCQTLNSRAGNFLFSLDTKREFTDNFGDFPNNEAAQGARYMYGYLAYLLAEEEGV